MYPQFCAFSVQTGQDDRYLAAVAVDFGLGNRRPGAILGERENLLEVLVGVDRRTTWLPENEVRRGLAENVAMALMDAVEEAIEDALETEPTDTARVTRLEETLQLLEQCLGSPEGESAE